MPGCGLFMCVCVCASGLHVCICAYAWLWVMRSPISWAILQVSWELGCFCLWFNPGRGVPSLRTYPLSSPRKHLCVLPRSMESLQGGGNVFGFSCACREKQSLEWILSNKSTRSRQWTAYPPGLGSRDLVGGLAKGRGVFREDT